MEDWEKKTIKQYGDMDVLDYCIDCGIFVCGITEHRTCGHTVIHISR